MYKIWIRVYCDFCDQSVRIFATQMHVYCDFCTLASEYQSVLRVDLQIIIAFTLVYNSENVHKRSPEILCTFFTWTDGETHERS